MLLNSKKGYSLIEIGVGLLILTVFFICSLALFNGCYNAYRMIQQRNLAINLAISNMEEMLQTDANVLTGFFYSEYNNTTNEYDVTINPEFDNYVKNSFDTKFKKRYAKIYNLDVASVDSITEEEREEFILKDKEYLINAYISDAIESLSSEEYKSEDVRNGNYAMLTNNVIETGNMALFDISLATGDVYNGEMAVRKTITRLPFTDTEAFGNNVLKLKVEVLYTDKVRLNDLKSEDIKSITLESVKIAE